jgi:hypothetical protein
MLGGKMFNKKRIQELENENKVLLEKLEKLESDKVITEQIISNLNVTIKNKDLEIEKLISGIESVGLSYIKLTHKGDMWHNRSKILLRAMVNNAIKKSSLEDLHNSNDDFWADYLNSLPGYDKETFSEQLKDKNKCMAAEHHGYIRIGLNEFLIED